MFSILFMFHAILSALIENELNIILFVHVFVLSPTVRSSQPKNYIAILQFMCVCVSVCTRNQVDSHYAARELPSNGIAVLAEYLLSI